ncbi:hypothetical protein [Luteimonas salinilitoris]|uniref:hypothetical protein n=1 Tax=Luteimonas salinilitoris TaxID=3237697 RepID=UPI00351C0BA1
MTVIVWVMWGFSVQKDAAHRRGAGSKEMRDYAGSGLVLQDRRPRGGRRRPGKARRSAAFMPANPAPPEAENQP